MHDYYQRRSVKSKKLNTKTKIDVCINKKAKHRQNYKLIDYFEFVWELTQHSIV